MAARLFAIMTVLVIGSGMRLAAAADIERLIMPGPVIAGHADIESDCKQCHTAFKRERQRDLCIDCHEDVGADIAAGTGFHGRDESAGQDKCSSCHTDHEGRDFEVVDLDTEAFDHTLTDFSLLGKHAETACEDCHAPADKYREAPQACFGCHEDDDEHQGGLGTECGDCHQPTDWKETDFDHFDYTGYGLIGGHSDVECLACHVDHHYENTPTDCYACHADDDAHDGENGKDCAFCHTVRSWQELVFDHAAETGFALLGKHGEIGCMDCHTSTSFDDELQSECIACHRDDDAHDGINGEACGDCHTPVAWTDSSFDHDRQTDFPLRGAHAEAECQACHKQPAKEVAPPTDCYGCHAEDDAHDGQEGRDCAACHNERDWKEEVRFDHDLTLFPLIGKHRESECKSCHEDAKFKDAPEQCVDCHREDDVHAASLGEDCGLCHNPVDWKRWEFDHATQTRFVLDGAHEDLACDACHTRPLALQRLDYRQCIACHRADDVHAGEFGNDCSRCHNTSTFKGARREP